VFEQPYDGIVEGLFDGEHQEEEIASALAPDVRSLLTPEFYERLGHPDGDTDVPITDSLSCAGRFAAHGVRVPLVDQGAVDHFGALRRSGPQIARLFDEVAHDGHRPGEARYPVAVPPAGRDNHLVEETRTPPAPVVLGVDDLRPLPGATRIARTSREGVRLLEEHRDSHVDELWLDHDLGGDDTVMPVVTLLEEAAFNGRPFRIGTVFVHSANPIGAETVVRSLTRWGYRVRRATA